MAPLRLLPNAASPLPPLPPLPPLLTSFVGRVAEVDEIARLLTRQGTRLLTLTGPGGVGKTRLAVEAAGRVREHLAGGVGFVPLAPVRDAELVAATIAHHLGLRLAHRQSPVQQIRARLQGRSCLLLLDNFEQVLDAAPFVAELLAACPDLTTLVTSRAPLRISGEREYPVPPLSLSRHEARGMRREDNSFSPHASSLPPHASEAVRLFVERAQGVRPGFALTETNAVQVGAICARLDGLPLAVELAAANVRVLPPAALLAQMEQRLPLPATGPRDAPARQRTMRDAIGWSYDLLSPAQQSHFQRLSVFFGGFSLDGAAAVGGEVDAVRATQASPLHASSPAALFDSLAVLVEQSLIQAADEQADEPRYVMLETIREFGLERLEASGAAAAVRQAHADYVLTLAETVEPHLFGPEQARWRALLDQELGNLRAALTWFAETDAVEHGLRLASATVFLWVTGSRFAEGRRWLERGLGRIDDVAPPIRARAMLCAGFLAHYRGDEAAAVAHLEEGLALARPGGPSYDLAFGHFARGIVAEDTGDYDGAVPLLTEAVDLLRANGRPAFAELARFHLGVVRFGRGDLPDAALLISESLDRLRELRCDVTVAATSDFLGLVALARGQTIEATDHYREALSLTAALRTPEGIVRGLAGVACLAAALDAADVAARLFGASAAAGDASGYALALPERAVFEGASASVRATLGETAFAEHWSAGRAITVEEILGEAVAWLAQPRADDHLGSPAGTPSLARLTPRELDVLRLVAAGHGNRAIADALFLSPATVKRHVTNILAALGLSTRADAIALALRAGLANDESSRP